MLKLQKINFLDTSMSIFKSHNYVQVSNFPYLGTLCPRATFLREETMNGVKWSTTDGKKILITDKVALKRLDKLWDERNYNGF